MSREQDDRNIGTADLVAAADSRTQQRPQEPQGALDSRDMARDPQQPTGTAAMTGTSATSGSAGEELAALFDPSQAQDFRSRWSDVQIGFVDDPHAAVQRADELVAQVMKSLAESFANQRSSIEAGMGQGDTENLRVALRRYRSFFERLLSI